MKPTTDGPIRHQVGLADVRNEDREQGAGVDSRRHFRPSSQSRLKLADAAGLSKPTVSLAARGGLITPRSAFKIADALSLGSALVLSCTGGLEPPAFSLPRKC